MAHILFLQLRLILVFGLLAAISAARSPHTER
jgi:hypothetical protein